MSMATLTIKVYKDSGSSVWMYSEKRENKKTAL